MNRAMRAVDGDALSIPYFLDAQVVTTDRGSFRGMQDIQRYFQAAGSAPTTALSGLVMVEVVANENIALGVARRTLPGGTELHVLVFQLRSGSCFIRGQSVVREG